MNRDDQNEFPCPAVDGNRQRALATQPKLKSSCAMSTSQLPSFGTYRLNPVQAGLLAFSQRQPRTWLGRRLALIARKLVLHDRRLPIDASTEGFQMRVYPRDNISERKFLFMPQFCDVIEREFLSSQLTPDGVFLDIGANAGIYTLTAARRFSQLGGRGYVLAVEANPTMQARLSYNVALNDLAPHVQLAPIALSDRDGEVTFSISARNLGESSLLATDGQTIRVPALTLASLLGRHGVTRLDGMKIDVEGLEDVILVPFLEQAQHAQLPDFIIIENSSDRWRVDVLGLLAAAGYEIVSRCKMNLILKRPAADRGLSSDH